MSDCLNIHNSPSFQLWCDSVDYHFANKTDKVINNGTIDSVVYLMRKIAQTAKSKLYICSGGLPAKSEKGTPIFSCDKLINDIQEFLVKGGVLEVKVLSKDGNRYSDDFHNKFKDFISVVPNLSNKDCYPHFMVNDNHSYRLEMNDSGYSEKAIGQANNPEMSGNLINIFKGINVDVNTCKSS